MCLARLLSCFAVSCLTAALAAADELPKTTHDGLVLKEQTAIRAAYVKPGATLAPYSRTVCRVRSLVEGSIVLSGAAERSS